MEMRDERDTRVTKVTKKTFIHQKLSVFLTDLSFIRIQKRSYAEASRRVIPHVVDGLIRTNKVISCILSLYLSCCQGNVE